MLKDKENRPPEMARRFLLWFLRTDLAEEVLGDLDEKFYATLEKHSLPAARRSYWYQVFHYLRPFAMKSWRSAPANYGTMYRYHFKVALRNVARRKGFFAINVAGLAVGIATCLLILLYVADELGYDRHFADADRIYRVVLDAQMNGELIKEAVTPPPVARSLEQEFPEVLAAARLRNLGRQKASSGNVVFRDNSVAFVDPEFLEVFSLSLVRGDRRTVLAAPNSAVITRKTARKYFGEGNPIGQVMKFEDLDREFEVTGIIEEVPDNSHFHFDVFASMQGVQGADEPNWIQSNYHTYLLLDEGNDPQGLEAKLPAVVEKNMGPQLQQALGLSFAEFKEGGNHVDFHLQPITAIHLHSDFSDASELEPGGDINAIYIFSVVAVIMLLIAGVNFVNLSTAGAAKRAKEVGMRKLLGSEKRQLISQFLVESYLVTSVALLLAVGIATFNLPLFNQLAGKELAATALFTPRVLLYLLLCGIALSLLAGSYPAVFIASFKPIDTLKSKFAAAGKSNGVRSALVIFQFTISVGLIIATLVVDRQMFFIQHKPLGYDRDQILVVRDAGLLGNKEEVFKDNLLKDPRVENVTISGFVPAGPTYTKISNVYPASRSEAIRRMNIYDVDHRYLPTMGMQLLEGRNFSEDFGAETSNIIINETAAEIFQLGADPVGKRISMTTDLEGGREQLTVVGLVRDFHFQSLHKPIAPLILQTRPGSGVIVRANTTDMPGLLAHMQELWRNLAPQEPFAYTLLDESYAQAYLAEQKMGNILRIFAWLTIFVACLGLFGLVTFTTEQRFKEIAIRKIVGSTVPQIVQLLAKDFVRLILIAFALAFPLGYYLMNKWLQGFEYRIEISWWIFVLAGLLTLVIALLTISFHSIKAALANPVQSLRSE